MRALALTHLTRRDDLKVTQPERGIGGAPWLRETLRRRAFQALGLGILIDTLRQAFPLLAAFPRYYGAETYWWRVGSDLPVWLLCCAGAVAFLRGRLSGLVPLGVAGALHLSGWLTLFFPSLTPLLGSPRY